MKWYAALITILSGQTLSPALDLDPTHYRLVRRILVIAPATLAESVTVLVSTDNVTYGTLQSGGSDITFPAGKATQINGFQCRYIKFQAGGAVAADRTFDLTITAEET